MQEANNENKNLNCVFFHLFTVYVINFEYLIIIIINYSNQTFSCEYCISAHRTDKETCIYYIYLTYESFKLLFSFFFGLAKALSIYSSLVCTYNEFCPRILFLRLDFYLCTCCWSKKKLPLLRVFITGPLYESKEIGARK